MPLLVLFGMENNIKEAPTMWFHRFALDDINSEDSDDMDQAPLLNVLSKVSDTEEVVLDIDHRHHASLFSSFRIPLMA